MNALEIDWGRIQFFRQSEFPMMPADTHSVLRYMSGALIQECDVWRGRVPATHSLTPSKAR